MAGSRATIAGLVLRFGLSQVAHASRSPPSRDRNRFPKAPGLRLRSLAQEIGPSGRLTARRYTFLPAETDRTACGGSESIQPPIDRPANPSPRSIFTGVCPMIQNLVGPQPTAESRWFSSSRQAISG